MEYNMRQPLFNLISRVSIITLFGSFLLAQQLDDQDIAYNDLKNIVETASRSQKTVWVEDFTGIM